MPLDLARIRAVCFDVDGTLSDTDDHFVQKLSRALRRARFLFPAGDPVPFARWLVMRTERPGNLLIGIPDRLGIDHHLAAMGDALYRLGLGRSSAPFLLMEGVRELLIRLRARYPLSIVSARGQRTTLLFLQQFDLSPFFRCVATAQTCRYTKPYPHPILWAAAQMEVPPDACVMIGDTPVDIRAGKAAGAQTVGVLCGFGEADELQQAGADLILPRTCDLAEILLKE